jgi:hypothetical protein
MSSGALGVALGGDLVVVAAHVVEEGAVVAQRPHVLRILAQRLVPLSLSLSLSLSFSLSLSPSLPPFSGRIHFPATFERAVCGAYLW